MSDYGDFEDDYDFEFWDVDGFGYVEEAYHPADDLAERAVASPPPPDGPLPDGYEDWDRFDYWYEIEEGDGDGYEDREHGAARDEPLIGRKRKQASSQGPITSKKQRVGGEMGRGPIARPVSPAPTVLWRSWEDRLREPTRKTMPKPGKMYALLSDWRDRFGDDKTPAEVLRQYRAPRGKKAAVQLVPPSPPSDDDQGSEEEDVEPFSVEALQAALQNRLAATGGIPEGFDSTRLLQCAMRMLLAEGDSDDVLGELAEELLVQPTEENGGISRWLAQQVEASKASHGGEAPTEPDTETDPYDPTLSNAHIAYSLLADQGPSTSAGTTTSTSSLPSKLSNAPPTGNAKSPRSSTAIPSKDTPPSTATPHPPTTQTLPSTTTTMKKPSNPTAAPAAPPRKRKAIDQEDIENVPASPPKKRAGSGRRTFDAPTASSRAKATPAASVAEVRATRVLKGRGV